MIHGRKSLTLFVLLLLAAPSLFSQAQPVELQLHPAFRFVIYGDTRFHDPSDHEASNPPVRQALVQAIDNAHPAFVAIGGDIVYNGNDANDWKTWDTETSLWRLHHIPVYPVLGNHDLHGDQKVALGYFFQRFPDLHGSRYYSVRSANTLLLVLDSSQDDTSGSQGDWLNGKLEHLPADVDFVFIALHHPPYTSSSDDKKYGGGHSARPAELALAKMLEDRQTRTRARFILFASHVHNYERHEHHGVTYFVTGGGGAHAYPIERAPEDPFQSKEINYHYLLIEVDHSTLKITMNRIELVDGKAQWSQPDSVTITAPPAAPAKAAAAH
jgi:hypothetical protein